MKKILLMLLVLLGLGMTACSLEGFGSNNNNKPEHKHSIVEGWKNDSANHWQICDSCDEKINFGAHEFSEWEEVEGLDLEIRSCVCGWEEQRSTTPVAKDLTVYYYNTLGWESVNAYVWNGEGAELNGSWPGSTMVAESDNWYTVTVSATSLEGLNIIFNDGTSQTADIALNNSDTYYYGNNGIGFASKEAAIEAYEAEQEVAVVYTVEVAGTSYTLSVNPSNASEYQVLDIPVLAGQEVKVLVDSVVATAIADTYEGNNLNAEMKIVNDATASIYVKPAENGWSVWVTGYVAPVIPEPEEKIYTVEINGVSYTLVPNPDTAGEYQVLDIPVLAGQEVKVLVDGVVATAIADTYQGNNLNAEMKIVNDATASIYVKPAENGWSVWVTGYVAPVIPEPEEKNYTVEINGVSQPLALNTNNQDAVEYFVKGIVLNENDVLVVKLNGEAVEATADPYKLNNLTSDMKIRTATTNAEHGIYVKVSADSYVVWVDGYKAPVDEDVETLYYLVGDFNEWSSNENYKFSLNPDNEAEQVLENVIIGANTEFKLISVQGETTTWLGYSIFEGDTELSISGEGNGNIIIGEAGTYNFYYKVNDNKLWVSKVQTSGGETPEPTEKIYTIEINGVSHALVLDEDAVLDTTQIAEYTVTIDSVLKDQTVVVKLNGEAIINIGAHGAGQNVSGNGGEGMSIINDASNVVVAFKLWQDGGHSLAISGYVKPAEQESLTVYYFNSNNWDKVSCYTWGTASNITGGWPGKEMTPVEGKTGWYTITLTDDSLSGLSIQFNCGGNTNEINVNVDLSGVNVYYYGKVKTGYASFESVEEAIEAANNQSSSANLFLNCGGSGLWDQAGAWFAVYCWNGSGSEWFEMKDSNGDGIYETNIGEDYENVIFCRMASDKTQLDFSSAWNKTGDLSLPTDGSNLYTISGWGSKDGSWSTK